MNTKDVRRWVDDYESAWREQDSATVARLFTEQAHYLNSPYEVPLIGHEAIAAEWNDPRPFTMAVESITADGSHAVVRGEGSLFGTRAGVRGPVGARLRRRRARRAVRRVGVLARQAVHPVLSRLAITSPGVKPRAEIPDVVHGECVGSATRRMRRERRRCLRNTPVTRCAHPNSSGSVTAPGSPGIRSCRTTTLVGSSRTSSTGITVLTSSGCGSVAP